MFLPVRRLIGATLIAIAIGPIVLEVLGHQGLFVDWTNRWGTQSGWAIKAGLIVFGAGLLFRRSAPAVEPSPAPAWTPLRNQEQYDPIAGLYNKRQK